MVIELTEKDYELLQKVEEVTNTDYGAYKNPNITENYLIKAENYKTALEELFDIYNWVEERFVYGE